MRLPSPERLDARSPYCGAIRSADVEHDRFEIVCAPCHVQHQMREAPPLADLDWTPAELRSVVMPGIPLADCATTTSSPCSPTSSRPAP